MSWKIHDGTEIVGVEQNFVEVNCFAERLRKAVASKAQEIYLKLECKIATEVIDLHAIGRLSATHTFGLHKGEAKPQGDFHPLVFAFMEIMRRQREIKETNRRDPEVDFETSLVIVPVKGRLLAILETEKKELRDVYLGMPEVREFPYWNNTDRPKDVTEEEWEERARLWGDVFPGSETSHETGFRKTLVGTYTLGISKAEEVARHAETPSQRALALAQTTVVNERLKTALGDEESANPDWQKVWNLLKEANSWAKKTDEGMNAVSKRAAEYENLLPVITPELLLKRVCPNFR